MASTDRGQTVIDFAVGAGVFLIATGVVFAFIPTMFEPFASAAGSSPIVADRTADHLTGSLLVADPATPSTLSAACTAAFFSANESLGDAADCRFDASASTTTLLGIEGRDVNVTVRELGASPTTGLPVTRSVDGVDYMLTRGTADLQSSVTVSSRAVLIEGDRYRFVVKVAQ
ncbi:hypothetical protein halTADL_0268 [Halohasta litchfieldiae]|jgi:hypothetical protein|uniref:Uncharacterized protein n=1 Tax=Halohasta litchfieldiae TaxID=1073996 RepID=A0A1H6YJ27_9EURY|nr:hypothetical protein [Halohasta litchfieldiae]ATW87085.1 hypothetical protein halTADL_0268 [Halohasta litchfieldiae]SEJ37212.1 hypothetical protein SAMN05444271_1606 [Halohasta litchfieldiae]